MTSLVVTGSRGRLATALAPDIAFVGFDRADGDLAASADSLAAILTPSTTVLHMAALMGSDLEASSASLAMLLNVLRACDGRGVARFIYASSLAAEPEQNDLGYHSYYVATKRAGEAFTEAWTHGHPDRIGISLRFGAYPLLEQPVSCRMSQDAMNYWVRRALNERRAGYHVWNANSAGG